MLGISSKRPGVYPNYDNSGIIYGNDSAVGIVAKSYAQTGKVYEISSIEDILSEFGNQGIMYDMCRLALINGTSKIFAVSVGEDDNPDYETAFSLLSNNSYVKVVVCDSNDLSVHTLLKNSVLSSSNNEFERIGIVSCSNSDTPSEWAGNFDSERIVLIAQNSIDDEGNVQNSSLLSAALAGVICSEINPAAPISGKPIRGIYALSTNISEDDINSFINVGITPIEVYDYSASIICAVTSKKYDSGDDKVFSSLNSIIIFDDVISSVRKLLRKQFIGTLNNSKNCVSISTQVTIELEKKLLMGIIGAYEPPVVTISSSDNSTCLVDLSFSMSRGLNQIFVPVIIRA